MQYAFKCVHIKLYDTYIDRTHHIVNIKIYHHKDATVSFCSIYKNQNNTSSDFIIAHYSSFVSHIMYTINIKINE